MEYGTDRNDPASHPNPEVLAGYTVSRSGNTVTVKLALQNNGTFDAFGVQAVMYSPDGTTTINDNTIAVTGACVPARTSRSAVSSRHRQLRIDEQHRQAVLNRRLHRGQDKTYTFTVATPGVVGSGTTAMSWNDGVGNSGSLTLAAVTTRLCQLPSARKVCKSVSTLARSFPAKVLRSRRTHRAIRSSSQSTPSRTRCRSSSSVTVICRQPSFHHDAGNVRAQ